MSSLEIAELTGKLHANVMRDIRDMIDALGEGAFSFEASYRSGHREYPCYHLPRDLVFTLVTGYSIPLRKKVIDRWMELEEEARKAPVPAPIAIPQTLAQALRLVTIDTPIVHTSGNRVYATSKDVAAFFGKAHRNVLADIGSLIEADSSIQLNFQRIEEAVRVGFGFRKFPAYEMDRDGFTLLAMGFTGAKALQFKLKYIAAFNEAERRLKAYEQAPMPAPFAIPQTLAQALRLAADQAQRRKHCEKRSSYQVDQPKRYPE